MMDQPQRGLDVNLNHLVEHLVSHVKRGPLADVGGAVVDQDVDRPQLPLGIPHHPLQVLPAAHVARHRDHPAREVSQLAGGGLQVLTLPGGDGHRGPGPGEPMGNGPADAPSATGYQSNLSRQKTGGGHAGQEGVVVSAVR